MFFSKFRNNIAVKIFTNTYVIILTFFLIWMIFWDDNSYFVHSRFNAEVNDLEHAIATYETKIKEDKATIKKLQDSLQLERFAREKYLMKKENEDIYIIEFDTIKK